MQTEQTTITSQNEEMPAQPFVEQVKDPGVPEQIDSYVERIEKRAEGDSDVPMDDSGQPLVQPVQDDFQLPDDAVMLPMTQVEFEQGIEADVGTVARWLAEQCLYLIKKYGEKVFFRG